MLATTDLHGHIWPFDYEADRPSPRVGLAATADLIRQAREEVPNCLLLDNGDVLQGTALTDLAAEQSNTDACHPMIQVMNALSYDAGTLGNHDFNFGLAFLRRILAQAEFPIVCANLHPVPEDASDGLPALPPYTLIEREIRCSSGHSRPIRIAVIGVAPPQTIQWDAVYLQGRVSASGIVQAVRQQIAAIKAQRVDLTLVLCHSGLGFPKANGLSEDAALAVAELEGVDAVIAGHSHGAVPGPDYRGHPGLDAATGRVGQTPIVMARAFGACLGQIDMSLTFEDGQWRLTGSRSALRELDGSPPDCDSRLLDLTRPLHHATRARMNHPVGQTKQRLCSACALVGHAPTLQLSSEAQLWRARQMLAETPAQDLPLLSAVAPFKVGGRAGPGAFTDIPPGPLLNRHVQELSPFPNRLSVIEATGATLKLWLERAAALFHRISEGDRDVPLLQPDAAPYVFDVIFGLSYEIDLSQPALFTPFGAPSQATDPGAGRIWNLRYQNQDVLPADRFYVVTNNYRAAGGGGYAMLAGSAPLCVGDSHMREDLTRYIAQASPISMDPAAPWRFTPLGATVLFDTSPDISLRDTGALAESMELLGIAPSGFQRARLKL